ncbi:MAG: AtpZ/AtpI family protein [Defluviitaleaceae bacterium]|nr:AtpZ/AtpI family protein [Defluviitaleaceae bacterium]
MPLDEEKDRPVYDVNKIDRVHKREVMKGFVMLSQFGITMTVCVLLGVFAGKWLDNLLGTEPWLLLLFTFFGIAAALKSVFDLAKKDHKNVKKDDK